MTEVVDAYAGKLTRELTLHHQQATIHTPKGRPVRVDVGLVNLLPLLWRADYITTFSCQGGQPSTQSDLLAGVNVRQGLNKGYISFAGAEIAEEVADRIGLLYHWYLPQVSVGQLDEYYNGPNAHVESNWDNDGRSVLRFPPELIPAMTRVLQARASA